MKFRNFLAFGIASSLISSVNSLAAPSSFTGKIMCSAVFEFSNGENVHIDYKYENNVWTLLGGYQNRLENYEPDNGVGNVLTLFLNYLQENDAQAFSNLSGSNLVVMQVKLEVNGTPQDSSVEIENIELVNGMVFNERDE